MIYDSYLLQIQRTLEADRRTQDDCPRQRDLPFEVQCYGNAIVLFFTRGAMMPTWLTIRLQRGVVAARGSRVPIFFGGATTKMRSTIRSKRGWQGKFLRRQYGKTPPILPKSLDDNLAHDTTRARRATASSANATTAAWRETILLRRQIRKRPGILSKSYDGTSGKVCDGSEARNIRHAFLQRISTVWVRRCI